MTELPTPRKSHVASATKVHEWLLSHEFSAYDPFEGLNAWVRPLAPTKFLRQALQKSVRMAPLNPRPFLGIRPSQSTKAMGYFARAYLKLDRFDPGCGFADHARIAMEWLLDHPSPGYSGLAWGNHFDYQNRLFFLPAGEPTVVWTALIGHAFIDAWEQLKERRWLEAGRSVAAFILNDLERREAGDGICISYIPSAFCAVHNANLLAAGFLARVGLHADDKRALTVARDAVDYTVGCQHRDGSWWYGEADNLHWVDNFHTGYILDSLWWYMVGSGDASHAESLVNGADFFAANFFRSDGLPKYYPNRWWPVDIQCAAQGIESLVQLSRVLNPTLLPVAEQVAKWTIDHMQQPDGRFAYQLWPGMLNKTPMLHWGQATMLHALACLSAAEREFDAN
jgi:hypothetical protein